MFDGLFGEEDDTFQKTNNAIISSYSHNRGTRNMADEIELPPLPRKSFIGLKNQGATCYLNSFYQSLFMIPPIQKIFLELDLEQLFGTGKRDPPSKARNRLMAVQNSVRNAEALHANEAARPAESRHHFHEQILRMGRQRGLAAARHSGGGQDHSRPDRTGLVRDSLLRAVHPRDSRY